MRKFIIIMIALLFAPELQAVKMCKPVNPCSDYLDLISSVGGNMTGTPVGIGAGGLNSPNSWSVAGSNYGLAGRHVCSSANTYPPTDTTGDHCWCQLLMVTSPSKFTHCIGAWIYYGSITYCAGISGYSNDCAHMCLNTASSGTNRLLLFQEPILTPQ
ncbi:MAG: hypothetical protein LBL21_03905 [Rickettsiales bacterium]|jgi:hypothetical protein|nr:hypothetical protein [Rickettsiales bacterium]